MGKISRLRLTPTSHKKEGRDEGICQEELDILTRAPSPDQKEKQQPVSAKPKRKR